MKIELTKPRLYTCEGVTLFPGVNVVNLDAKASKRLLNNPGFQSRVKAGVIKVEGKDQSEPKEPNAKELAREIIPNMTDVAQLRKFADDGRQTVRESAIKRLDQIDQAGEGDNE